MATVRDWLEEAGFDITSGRIILRWQPGVEFEERERYSWSGDGRIYATEVVSLEHPWLNAEFSDDYGGVEAPRFVAEDARRIYFVGCYDGSSWLASVEKNLENYLSAEGVIPCVGGG